MYYIIGPEFFRLFSKLYLKAFTSGSFNLYERGHGSITLTEKYSICTRSKLLLIQFKLVYGPFVQNNMQYNWLLPKPARKETNVPLL